MVSSAARLPLGPMVTAVWATHCADRSCRQPSEFDVQQWPDGSGFRQGRQTSYHRQTGTKRLPNLADIATAQEQGLTDFEMTCWFGLFSAAKTPGEIVTRMNQEVQKALQSPDLH
jgi:tripartite-type tricarboxylate transporter receptor subunit TctC